MSALLFDLDETLVLEEASVAGAFPATCALAEERHGVAPAELETSVRTCARDMWHTVPNRPWCAKLGTSSFGALSADFAGNGPEFRWLRESAPTYRHEAWRRGLAEHGIADDELVKELASRYIEERHQRAKLEGAGLADYFASVTLSGEVGVGKPDPLVFHAALEALGTAASDCWMIGERKGEGKMLMSGKQRERVEDLDARLGQDVGIGVSRYEGD